MDNLQDELSNSQPLLNIEIMGVNWAGLESANSEATAGKSIPWLQDIDSDADNASDAWASWGAKHLDLIVLDAHNVPLGYINLIQTSLNEQDNYSLLHGLLVDAAMESQKPWHNEASPLDVDNDGLVIPLDVLIIVNRLNSVGSGRLPPPGLQAPTMFYDSNGDGDSTPLDALLVINVLNGETDSPSGEGESSVPPLSSTSQREIVATFTPSVVLAVWAGTSQRDRSPDSESVQIASQHFRTVQKNDLPSTKDADRVFRENDIQWLSALDLSQPTENHPFEDGAFQIKDVLPIWSD